MGANALSTLRAACLGNGWESGRVPSPPSTCLGRTVERRHKDSGRRYNRVRANNEGGGAGHALTRLTNRMPASQVGESFAWPRE
ncbi:MAG TPA: hypothetical protein VGE97_01930 [Nitrososphaera sp.]